jgi:hypothetical protein
LTIYVGVARFAQEVIVESGRMGFGLPAVMRLGRRLVGWRQGRGKSELEHTERQTAREINPISS